MLCKLGCLIQRLINVKENKKQNKIAWTAKDRVNLRDFRGRLKSMLERHFGLTAKLHIHSTPGFWQTGNTWYVRKRKKKRERERRRIKLVYEIIIH